MIVNIGSGNGSLPDGTNQRPVLYCGIHPTSQEIFNIFIIEMSSENTFLRLQLHLPGNGALLRA